METRNSLAKKVGKDYQEGKFTLPIITALKNADPKIQEEVTFSI